MDTVAASTVIGAFAYLTAKNVLNSKAETDKFDVHTSGSLSSLSMTSVDEIASSTNIDMKTLSKSLNERELSSLDIVSTIAAVNAKSVFDFKGYCQKADNVINAAYNDSILNIILGSLSQTGLTSVVTSSDLILHKLSEFYIINKQVGASVWHIGCQEININTLEQSSDYTFLSSIEFPTLVASNAKEVYEHAVISQYIASSQNIAIAACFDGVSAETQKSTMFSNLSSLPIGSYESNLLEGLKEASKALLGKDFIPLEYVGSLDAEIVFISIGAPTQAILNVLENVSEIGLVSIKLVRPFTVTDLKGILPKTVQRVCVVDYSPNKNQVLFDMLAPLLWNLDLKAEVFATLINSRSVKEIDRNVVSVLVSNAMSSQVDKNLVIDAALAKGFESKFSILDTSSVIGSISGFSQQEPILGNIADCSRFSVWSTEEEKSPQFSLKGIFHQITTRQDTRQGVMRYDVKVTRSRHELENFSQFGFSSTNLAVSFLHSSALNFAADHLKYGGKLIIFGQVSKIDLGVIAKSTRHLLFTKNISVYYLGLSSQNDTNFVIDYLRLVKEEHRVNSFLLKVKEDTAIQANKFVSRKRARPTSSIDPKEFHDLDSYNIEYKKAWPILFKEAYNTKRALRPSDHGVATAVVTKFERLTPESYSRNIFHVEFDISGTGLKYEIGDALGVFGENDPVKVDNFIAQYGLNPNELVTLKSRGKMNQGEAELVSIRNLLLKNLDLFGKVSKRFFSKLSEFATSRYERLKLLHTSTDDVEQYKLAGYEAMTPAELLLQYKSCKLSIQDIIDIVPEIKARHYSISSSMKISPTSVHLLVVAVDWITPLGKKCEGQCTRYLKNLKLGQKVSVDIQKSVLRLPPNPEQPIIMAGLGTGMAPFRAFIQQRYFMKMLGHKIGPMILYFGARHKAQEWLYGSELEQYERMGLLRLGLAWSRDQEHKVYIQDKIKEDKALLRKYLKDDNGYFYLCGPTWPVPDVRDAINSSLEDSQGVEQLKKEGRYILEVY